VPVRVRIRVEGLAELQRKLRKEVLLAPPLKHAMRSTIREAAELVTSRAPRASSRMATSVTHRVDARPVPTWGRVSVPARRRSRKHPRGYRYPRWLEYSSKSPRRGWFRQAVIPARGILARHLEAAKRYIESVWSR
jgi:hypothetical protein